MKTMMISLACMAAAVGSIGCSDSDPVTPGGSNNPGDIEGTITESRTLTADTEYMLRGLVTVEPGATLTIEPGTVIKGEKASKAILVIKPGAKIIADGKPDEPIVFTSELAPGERAPGDWGGLIILGNAKVNFPDGKGRPEGFPSEAVQYGGDNDDDNSGIIRYVRIEFSGVLYSVDNEVNGLTMYAVGRQTTVDYVMIHHTLDDCFEWYGGTVNGSHLICAYNGDDVFDWDHGWTGNAQFIVAQQDPSVADDCNGIEGDNDPEGSQNMPISNPTIYNATLCGKNADVDKQQYGILVRRSSNAHIFNTIATGFEAGYDLRDDTSSIEIKSSIFYGNLAQNANIAYNETGTTDEAALDFDDDMGFDEVATFNDPANLNSEMDPKIAGCFTAGAVNFQPETTLTTNAATPPDNGFFDTSATFIGAFSAEDNWAAGKWAEYEVN